MLVIESLTGMHRAVFDHRYRGSEVLSVPGGCIKYQQLMSWRRLNRILEAPASVLEHIVLIREGQKLDRRYYVSPKTNKLVPGAVRKALAEGCTLVVSSVAAASDDIQEINDTLCNELGVRVWTNVYVSWAENKGFLTHWDTHDVFILQTEGEKDWTVYRPDRKHGLEVDIESRDIGPMVGMTPAWEGRLKAGDVLYIPRGWWHHARATGTGSIHLTIGMDCVSGIQAIEYLAQEARQAEVFRRDLPTLGLQESDSASAEFEAALMEFFSRQVPGITRRIWNDYYGRLPIRSRHYLPLALNAEGLRTSNSKVQFAGIAPHTPLSLSDDHFYITMGGRRWKFMLDAYPVIEELVRGKIVSLNALQQQLGARVAPERFWEFVFELLNEGLINIVS